MIKHVVMWKLKPEAEGLTAKENGQWIREHLEGLTGVVPQLLGCEVGINVVEGNYDVCLVSVFNSLEDLDAYKVHPAHAAVAGYIGKVCEARVACDFEID